MKLTAYPHTKPSGVEWLGDVPDHWTAQGVKFCYSIQLGKMLQPEPSSPTDEETPYLKSQHVQWENVRVADLPTMWTNKKERRQYAVKDGDLLVCEGGDVGRAAVVRGAPDGTIIQNALHRVRPLGKNETGFLLYALAHAASQGWFEIICNRSTIAHFTVDKFGALGVALPTPAEQRYIAAFLDRETGRVDRLVAKKRELIERLAEKRIALISRTVIRGLSPAAARAAGLQQNPPLKSSGIDWLGDIPAHWDVKRFRRLIRHLDQGWSPNANNYPAAPDELAVLKLGAASKGRFYPEDNKALDEVPEGVVPITPANGDLLISRANTPDLVGDACVVKGDHPNRIIPDLLYRLRLRPAVNAEYICWFLLSRFGRAQIECDARGSSGSMVKLGQGHVRAWFIPFPPSPEQTAIAEFLDAETAKLDAMVTKVEEAVERLQEYRTALITAAVTGKIDVRKASEQK